MADVLFGVTVWPSFELFIFYYTSHSSFATMSNRFVLIYFLN
ncbi:hypothetical protein RT41_GL000168 [Lactococcus fujiensis JCM 16395]|uniref:Uncharacterized protein n=1 Tax=Lactococcus fujiensis JCM 16395 TaxID=1291764 RepID=A0A2A5RPP8_9LACT|nr:hypothetical protein RT41_GL000168 [Lactococcus fujiensis JCM 16395]